MATVIDGDFEWEDSKAVLNILNHKVTFEEAITAILDPNAVIFDDPTDPEHAIVIGMSARARLLVVVECERGARTRIVTARKAERSERKLYAQGG